MISVVFLWTNGCQKTLGSDSELSCTFLRRPSQAYQENSDSVPPSRSQYDGQIVNNGSSYRLTPMAKQRIIASLRIRFSELRQMMAGGRAGRTSSTYSGRPSNFAALDGSCTGCRAGSSATCNCCICSLCKDSSICSDRACSMSISSTTVHTSRPSARSSSRYSEIICQSCAALNFGAPAPRRESSIRLGKDFPFNSSSTAASISSRDANGPERSRLSMTRHSNSNSRPADSDMPGGRPPAKQSRRSSCTPASPPCSAARSPCKSSTPFLEQMAKPTLSFSSREPAQKAISAQQKARVGSHARPADSLVPPRSRPPAANVFELRERELRSPSSQLELERMSGVPRSHSARSAA
mmetsp:Transcript_41852/g.95875  ORF Transcript_41852/g.95875 Transcript_41852/m.95875 type:complete len:353 (+) Transcript_41852:135-1193(+)